MYINSFSLCYRQLDADSLMEAVKASTRLREACCADPVLRKSLREKLIAIKQKEKRWRLNPSEGVRVVRDRNGEMFGKNIRKNVIIPDLPKNFISDNPAERQLRRQIFNQVRQERKRNIRSKPYNLIRC